MKNLETQSNEQDVVMDWSLVNRLVEPEHQYLEVKNAPLSAVRMAWPFKTEEELRLLSKWFKSEQRQRKKEEKMRAIALGPALF